MSQFSNTAIPNSQIESSPEQSEFLNYVHDQRKNLEKLESKISIPTFSISDQIEYSPRMRKIKDLILQISDTQVPVLITGESGVGKEIIARYIHSTSNLNSGPFIAVNCAALPSNLLESELFGHEKGSFTGAHTRHIGKFEQANMGTILLDEITEMDLNLQSKLLRVLQEKEIDRVGGVSPIPIKTRIIATSNRDISKAVANGHFRQDLYYRLHVIHIQIPPLRERLGEIIPLANYFLKSYCLQFGRTTPQINTHAEHQLKTYGWPGNIRELQNTIQRAILLSSNNIISGEDLNLIPPIDTNELDSWTKHLPIGNPLRDVETQFILATLKHHEGNRTHAAKTLGISLRTLRNKINEFHSEGLNVTSPGKKKI
jgi:two-component system response regulator FlrC